MTKTEDQSVATDQSLENKPSATSDQSTELTISDLNALKVIIDVASQRGTFRPNEMEAVGKTYTKLNNFLIAVQAQQAREEPTGEVNA